MGPLERYVPDLDSYHGRARNGPGLVYPPMLEADGAPDAPVKKEAVPAARIGDGLWDR